MGNPNQIVCDPFTATLIRIKAAQLCRRTDFSWSDRDDLRQQMLLYLLQKSHLYDPARGNIEAFVTNAIDSWVAMELRYRGRLKRRGGYTAVSLEITLVNQDGNYALFRDLVGEADGLRRNRYSPASQYEAADTAEALATAVGALDPEDRELLRLVAEHGKSAAARQWSRRRVQNSLARIRLRFEAAGFGPD